MTLRPHAPRAYTLTEVVISSAILGVILLGLTSATRIVGKAMPGTTEGAGSVAAAASWVNTFADELAVAKSIAVAGPADIQFVVPDRNGDLADDTIRYTWSGVAGQPLTRTFNAGTAVTIVPNCRSFALTYDTAPVALPQTYSRSAETLIASWTLASSTTLLDIDSNTWRANYFVPTLPGNAVSWAVTRIEFGARKNSGVGGNTTIQLRTDRNGLPSTRVLASATYPESSLSSSVNVISVPLSQNAGLVPGQGMFIVWSSGGATMRILAQQSSTASSYLASSGNAGSTWSASGNSVIYNIYGTYVTPNAVAYRTAYTGVNYSIQSGQSTAAALSGRVRLYTQP